MFDGLREMMGGGTLTIWLALGGAVFLWIAIRAIRTVVKVVAFFVAAGLLLGIAPWSGEDVSGRTADCAREQIAVVATQWQELLTKRITVGSVSEGALCTDGGAGLAEGTATVRRRTFFDIPFDTVEVGPGSA